ncbi:MAG: sugar phosphate nucleotidyltransferase [Myxococcota bacterium]
MAVDSQAMLLAAGLGTRLWPLTADRAKPAVPFLGAPLVAHSARLLAAHGFARAVVNTHYQAESVRAALAGETSLAFDFSHEAEILGTAGGIAEALERGLLRADRRLLVMNAKLYTDLDLGAALAAHRVSGAAVTMVLRPNPRREEFREVLVEGGRVVGFGAKVPTRDDALLFTGVHILEPEVLASIPRGVFSDTVANTYPPWIERGAVHAHVEPRGRWWELSTLARYLELHQTAAREGLCPPVILGPGATIAPGASVTRAVLWDRASVGAAAVVEDAVLGEGVHLAPGEVCRRTVVIRRDRAPEVERGDIRGDNIYVPLPPA